MWTFPDLHPAALATLLEHNLFDSKLLASVAIPAQLTLSLALLGQEGHK